MESIIRKGYIGNPAQLLTLRRVTVSEGKAKGAEVIEIATPGGLYLEILPDNGLDIGKAAFLGTNMSWMSKNGYDQPLRDLPYENEFLNYFPGGMLYTCGLRSAGPANRDGGEWFPLHGRYHGTPAEHVSAYVRDDVVTVSGTVRETALFGHVLELTREITVPVFGSGVRIHDEIRNLTPRPEEYMMIYHCNFGYPMLSENARLVLPEDRETVPRTEFAKTGLGRELVFDAPVDNEEERVFFQKMRSDFTARLENPSLGVAAEMKWSGDTLPILTEWRSMASGDYVLGLEPTNCYINGRHDERENGTLPVIPAFGTVKNTVSIAFSRMGEKD